MARARTEHEGLMDDDIYLIWSNEHRAWWRAEEGGYTPRLSEAGRYTRRDALRICTDAAPRAGLIGALSELPVLAADVVVMHRWYRIVYRDAPPERWE